MYYKSRFVYAALAAPGGENDNAALRKTKFSQKVRKLPIGKFVIFNNVYVFSETLIAPFSVDEEDEPMKDAFNFYLSQVRIHIDQTF